MTVTHASSPNKRPPAVLNTPLVILNLFQDNEQTSHVILKQVQDDERVQDDDRVMKKGCLKIWPDGLALTPSGTVFPS
jgi:hypothetical protein